MNMGFGKNKNNNANEKPNRIVIKMKLDKIEKGYYEKIGEYEARRSQVVDKIRDAETQIEKDGLWEEWKQLSQFILIKKKSMSKFANLRFMVDELFDQMEQNEAIKSVAGELGKLSAYNDLKKFQKEITATGITIENLFKASNDISSIFDSQIASKSSDVILPAEDREKMERQIEEQQKKLEKELESELMA